MFVPAGTLLSRAAAAAGMAVETPCGGMGTCGKCRVIVEGALAEPDAAERRLLSDEDIAAGVRLACRTKVVGELAVTIPATSRSTVQKILSHGVLRECEIGSAITKAYCDLRPPSLEDERAEFERLADHLRLASRHSVHPTSHHSVRPTSHHSEQREEPDKQILHCVQNDLVGDMPLRPNLNVVRGLSGILRRSGYKVTATVHDDHLIALEPGDTTAHCHGIAYDLGSTTVVGYLMDLATGKELAVSAVMNPQTIYGEDLVSRISFATTQENGAVILRDAAVDALNRIAATLVESAGISREHVYKVTVVGNTCMSHLLLGIDVTSLGQSPYVPSLCADVTLTARELGLDLAPEAVVVVLPNVAGFVGSDLVGVLLSSMWHDDGTTRLAVDIGTNGEMALLHNGRTYVCSAAAGPAFEGAGISCGMRGGPGAIDSVVIGEDVRISTIDNRRPIGLCGSGLVDAVAQMLDAGVIDESGRLLSPAEATRASDAVRRRLVETDAGVRFVLATRQESGSGKAIALNHSDVRHLQLAKGSIRAAIATLIRTAGASESDLSEILLAGAFGNYIRVESAIRIGLIPAVPREKVTSIGNAAGAGARLALLCDHETELARRIAQEAEHIELAVSPDYQMELMERMMFLPACPLPL